MKTNIPLTLITQLAKIEYCKDNGLPHESLESLSLQLLHRSFNGEYVFDVFNNNHLVDPQWAVDRRDLTSINQHHLRWNRKSLSKNEVCELVNRALGLTLINIEINTISPTKGGWLVTINNDSVRFTGSFKIKNH